MTKRLGWVAVLLYLLIYIAPLGVRPVAITDEARYAEIPREMVASGDWIVPRLNGLRYFEKPVLGYWLNAVSILTFGENAFAVRFPSALAVGLTALLLFRLVRRETGRPDAAILSAITYMTSVLPLSVGLTSVLDSPLVLFVTAAIVFFLDAYRDESAGWPRVLYLSLFGIACGLGFLTKGFVALAVPVVVIVPFMLAERRLKDLFLFPAWPVFLAVLVVLPWAILVQLHEPDYWRYFFWEEHIRRYMANDAQHLEPIWFFLPVLAGGAMPWLVLAPAAAMGLTKEDRYRRLIRFCLFWFIMPVLFFSSSRGKLGTYILPCFPAFGVLAALGLLKYAEGAKRRAWHAGAVLLALLPAALAIGLVVTQCLPSFSNKLYSPFERLEWPVLAAGLIAWSAAAAGSIRARSAALKLSLLAAGFTTVAFSLLFAVPERVSILRSAEDFLSRHRDSIPPESILVSDANRFHSVCWFLKRSDVYVMNTAGEVAYGLSYEDSRHRLLDARSLRGLIEENRGRRPVTIVTAGGRYDIYRDQLPAADFELYDHAVHDERTLVMAQFGR